MEKQMITKGKIWFEKNKIDLRNRDGGAKLSS